MGPAFARLRRHWLCAVEMPDCQYWATLGVARLADKCYYLIHERGF